MLNDFIFLIFPQSCASCGKSLYKNEKCICTSCTYQLPKTNFHLLKDNPIAKTFWGRVPIYSSGAFYEFNKGGKVQELIHQLKYKGQKSIGFAIGELYGLELKKSADFKSVNLVIPVPLHVKKQKKRGYNQSDSFAQGLAKSLHAETNTNILLRKGQSESQTSKSRFKRWQNVESAFQLSSDKDLAGKHILLVDDVVTTGATLEACAQTLQKIPNVKISVATIAYAAN